MKTIRCRNCGISYQETATFCLRCLSPLEKLNLKIVSKFQLDSGQTTSFESLNRNLTNKSTSSYKKEDHQKLIQQATRPKNVGSHVDRTLDSTEQSLPSLNHKTFKDKTFGRG